MLGKRFKGDYEFATTPLGVILFVGMIVALVIFAQTYLLNYSAQLKISQTDLQSVDAAHIIKECFGTNLDGSIPADYLQANKGSNICTLCKCSGNVGAKIQYLEGPNKGKSYDFNYAEKGSLHKIFVTVNEGDYNYVSRLYVNVYV
jgi:hypothetical protein